MCQTYKKSQSFRVGLSYVPDTLSTLYGGAANVQRAPHTRLGHATEAISHKIGTRVERTLACLKRAPNAFKRIQRACSACGTYSKHITHTPGTRRASSMFKKILIPMAPETRDDF